MNVVKDIWTKSFIHNTYSCIECRGIHLCASNLKRDLRKYPNETKYCLKLDIRKFYPSIPHDGLKECIRKKIKDKDFLIGMVKELILLNMIGVFILKIEKKILNFKHNIL